MKNYNDKFQFQLTQNNGFLLLANDRIVCTNEKVDQSIDQALVTIPNNVKNSSIKFNAYHVWVPVPQSKEKAMEDYPYVNL